FIARWPKGIPAKGEIRRQFGYLPDLMATAVDLAGATYPAESRGHQVPPMAGVSLMPAFSGQEPDRRWPVFLEHEGNRAVFDRHWKLVSKGGEADYGGEESWELYNLETDRSELRNLRDRHPERVAAMSRQWREWAENHRVLPNGRSFSTERTFTFDGKARL